ncbi:MAG: amidohydrolase [Alphaproteobacteria bacterium RIFCSPHIGHO2_12_FULL_63_12]|nr:MAG: amidohydrolase [Alphaproteobacteria bacterium RIFCSPHIGHO2_12_FULL_63_12]
MMNRNRALFIFAALALGACGKPHPKSPDADPAIAADAVYFGGPIYTGVAASPVVEAVAVKEGRIIAAGAKAGIDASIGPDTDIIDLKGAALYPGFVDSHAHLLGIGMRELTLNLEGVASVEELVDIAASAAQEAEADAVIYGRGWIETGWPEGRFPSRQDLDQASALIPIVFERADGHALVANSAAISKAGVTRETKDPDGGRIEKDAAGEPTGMFIDNAMDLINKLIAAPSEAKKREAYEVGGDVYAAYGWTGLHNVSVDPADLSIMEEESAAGKLNIRVYNAIERSGYEALAAQSPRVNNSGRILTRAIKLYADGALGSRGAALSEPYSDRPDTSGLMLTSHDEIEPFLQQALRDGVQIATHAIGDRGNKLVLDWYEEAFNAVPPEERKVANPRWRIEHAQILHDEDIPRFAKLGVIASMEPSHAIGDFYFAPARLGDARLDGAYAWRSLLDSGAIIAGGSDAPVERGDPLIEFYAAVARKDLEGKSGPDWRPGEKVTRAEALAMFTSSAAFASFQEADLGTIEAGKKADFTIFSKDIMTVPEAEILTAKPVMTVVDGDVVFRAGVED